jgi:hypothetical protein
MIEFTKPGSLENMEILAVHTILRICPIPLANTSQEWMQETGLSFIQPKDIHPESLQIDEHPEVKIYKMDLDIKPNPKDKLHLAGKQVTKPIYRPVVTVTNGEIEEGGTVRVHVSVLDHMESMEEGKTPYAINQEIKKANAVVVGSLDKELEAETKIFKELLERY